MAIVQINIMKTKPLTFLLALTFMFLFSGSSVVFGDDLRDGLLAYGTKDYKKAYKLILPLAEQGNVTAQTTLGVMYQEGHEVSKDYKEAVKWYRRSAERGYVIAQHNLGVMYLEGYGVPQDHKEAEKWFRRSAEQGIARAQEVLDLFLERKGQKLL